MSEAQDRDRLRWLQQLLEMIPAVISWAVLVAPVWLSFRYPWLAVDLAIAGGLYWLTRALWCSASAIVVAERVRHLGSVDWTARLASFSDRPARREALLRSLTGLPARRTAVLGFSGLASTRGERRRAMEELAALDALDRLEDDPPPPGEVVHVVLIPTDTEPLHTLRQTIRAAAEADWPSERTICAVITRQSDEGGKANVDTVRAEFGRAFAEFLHFVDPGRPGIAVGKRSAMAFGGRRLYRILVRERGIDPRRILVTDLDPDYRLDRQYFSHLTWTHLTTPDRETAVYQPMPYLHNGLWQSALPLRLFAAALTQVQMWRVIRGGRLRGFGSYAMTLDLLHRIGFWATDATVLDSRLYWRGYFIHGDRFRIVPLLIGVSGDAARVRSYLRSLATEYLRGRRWAWGASDGRYLIANAIHHPELPFRSRAGHVLTFAWEHVAWAIAPLVVAYALLVPILAWSGLLGPTFGGRLPLAAAAILGVALAAMLASIWVAGRAGPAKPASWGLLRRGLSSLGWVGLPFVALLFSGLPALDAPSQPLTGRYRPPRGRERE